MPPNQTSSEGNDDHAFWGLAAMTAAEANYPNPPAGQPQWLALAQAVFNLMAANWDTSTCNGGLRWQIFQFNKGYNYKNSISNGCLFHLAARLARYTGNDTYATWANTTWNWMLDVGISNQNASNSGLMSSDYSIVDGADVPNCTDPDMIQWSYNNGQFLSGCAYLYNYTNGDSFWKEKLDKLLSNALTKFFTSGANILYEPACEVTRTCNTDQTSFKGYLAEYLAYVTQMAPYTASQIYSYLATSATAAGATCSGTGASMVCSLQWTTGKYDGTVKAVGEQLSVLNVLNANLVKYVNPPVTNNTGGTSQGDPNAGTSSGSSAVGTVSPATTGDKALAGVLTGTTAILLGLGGWLMIS
jgi:mannan endo-1,6-alpha-mannosidase